MGNERDLVIRYGQMLAAGETVGLSIKDIVLPLLRRSVPQADRASPLAPMYFEVDGWKYGVDTATRDGLRKNVNFASRMVTDADGFVDRFAVLCWDGTAEQTRLAAYLKEDVRGSVVVLDRSHLEAALTGVGDLMDFIRQTFHRRKSYVPLCELLVPGDAPPVPLSMRPASWPKQPESAGSVSPDVRADMLLVGEPGAALPLGGLAYEAPDRLLVTCADGVVELNPSSGSARWKFGLPGCHGAPLPLDDGSVCVLSGSALVKWHDSALTVVAGPFEAPAHLLRGPEGQPWVLSGSGGTFGVGESTLALTRVGGTLDDQLRYPIAFDAAVRSAASLGARRFLLAADGHSAIIDLKRGTGAGMKGDWAPTPVPYPHHLLVTGPEQVAVASPDGSGTRVLVRSMNLLVGATETTTSFDVALGRLHGMTQDRAGSTFLLGSLPGNDPDGARLALVRLTALPQPSASGEPEASAHRSTVLEERYDAVGLSAQGREKDYVIESKPMATGGQALIYRAVHKATGIQVAFKRRNKPGQGARRRWRRELDCARQMGSHPGSMPILDADTQASWYVMPLAEATAEQRRVELADPLELSALVSSVASALDAAHQHGWIHRDITPPNILLYDGRWRLADWGIARRPRGQTSAGGRLTEVGVLFGTEGFVAPELARDANEAASPASDIYSLGQLIGWILTGITPQPNVPMVPPSGPWREVVRVCTRSDPSQRPQDIPEFLDLVGRATVTVDELPISRAEALLDAAHAGDARAVANLIDIVADRPSDYELHVLALVLLHPELAGPSMAQNVPQAVDVLQALATHTSDANDTWPEPQEQDRAILWLWGIARYAADAAEWDLLEVATRALCTWDGRWDRSGPQRDIQSWLVQLSGHAADVVAGILREHPSSAVHFRPLADDRRTDRAIRSAVYSAWR